MRGKKFILIATVVIITALAVYFAPFGKTNLTTYIMDVKYDDTNKVISGLETVDFINTDDTVLNQLYLHLYPNAFKEKDKIPFAKEEVELAYPDGFKPGYIDIKNITFDGKKIGFI